MEATKYDMSPNPSDKANIISRALFLWTLPMFKRGYSKVLEIGDLFGPKDTDKSDRIGDTLERHWNEQVERCADKIKSKNITDPEKLPKPSLTTALFYTFKWHFFGLAILVVLNDVFIKLTIPMLLGRLLPYFSPNPTATAEEAMGYAGGIVALNFLGSVVMNHYMLGAFHMGMRARVAVCSLIYRKSLKLSRTALGESAPGKVVNLLSNDVNRFDLCAMFLHYLWVGPLSSLLVMWFLFQEVGVSGVFGVVVIFTVMPLQAYTGKLSARFRLQTAIRTDERVRLMDEIISGVQVIKMYAWEKPFALLIRMARKFELAVVRKNSYVRAVYMSFLLFTTRASIFCTMASLMAYGDGITASKVFVFSSYFSVLSNTMSGMFVRAISETAEAMVSIKRLERYLSQDEFREKPIASKEEKSEMAKFENGSLQSSSTTAMAPGIALEMTKATGKWLDSSEEWTLENISLNIPKGKLVGIIGPVGAGKSSLLQAILGEMNLSSGCVQVSGSVSYACQEPWVFGGTVRQNILFGLHYDKFRYNEVVRVCALQKDFQQFSHGDHTLVGERGASLSGGQKARINLARAVYRQSEVYLLDDPLSAVDAHVGKHLYEKCIGAHLKNKTRLLVTHQLHYLQDADIIVMMRDGKIELQGTYHELATSSLDYARMLIPQQDKIVPDEIIDESKDLNRDRIRQRRNMRQNSVSSQHSFRSMSLSSSFLDLTEYNAEEDAEMEEKAQTAVAETSSKGMVEGSVGLQYAAAGGGKASLLFVLFMFVATQAFTSMFDYFVSYWASQEELRTYYKHLNETLTQADSGLISETDLFPTVPNGTGLNETMIETKLQPYESLLSTNMCMIIHGSLVSAILVVGMLRAILFYNRCVKASGNLHDNMFRGIIRSPMKFFDDNPSGRIMNRFSKDMGAIDEVLPKCTMDATQMILTIVGAVVVACIVNPIYLAFLAGLGVFFYLLRKVYLRTSKNIKRLEGMSRSPVFTHLGATLQGLPTIRASHAQSIIKTEFDKLQDTHTSAFYMFITTSSAFGFALDMLCLIFVSLVTFSFFLFDKDTLGDKVGLAITQAMSLTFLMQYGVRQSAEVANQLMAVERLLEYTQLQPENGIGPDEGDKRLAAKRNIKLRTHVEPSRGWPEFGRIELRAMSLRYGDSQDSQRVLRELTCVIEPREKVGIVGRTGAGKSSLIQALFRLAFIEGDIMIDGVNTYDITLEALRRQLSIIPQDPMLFSGTLRRNLDPFEEYSDQKLWQALEEVELKESFNNPSGLEMRVMDGGANFSVGQRQLVCLARALLRNNRILMMDEATANVDPHTDELIQQTIRSKFADCTVLTIAHRLNTIMDSDKVLVMDRGSIVEFAHPHELMEMRGSNSNEDGHFRKMVLETGAANTEKLAEVARQSYVKKYLATS